MSTRLQDGFDRVRQAAKAGIANVAGLAGKSDDPDVILYDSLEPEDFDGIVKEQGFEATMKYIQEMESRKARKVR